MDITFRTMKQIQVSTSLTLVKFLSLNLSDFLNPLDTCILALLILMLSLMYGHDYVLSSLSRRLAALMILENIRPIIVQHIDKGTMFKIHGLIVNAGFISMIALIPASYKENEEVSILIQSFIYLYSNIFEVLGMDEELHVVYFSLSIVIILICSKIQSNIKTSMFATVIEIGSTSATFLALNIVQQTLSTSIETRILQLVLIMLSLQFFHLSSLTAMHDYMTYQFAVMLLGLITKDVWYWCGFLFLIFEGLKQWIPLDSMPLQVVLVMLPNLVVMNVLAYIRQLAIHDTIITLKTSAIVLQFLIYEMTLRFSKITK